MYKCESTTLRVDKITRALYKNHPCLISALTVINIKKLKKLVASNWDLIFVLKVAHLNVHYIKVNTLKSSNRLYTFFLEKLIFPKNHPSITQNTFSECNWHFTLKMWIIFVTLKGLLWNVMNFSVTLKVMLWNINFFPLL